MSLTRWLKGNSKEQKEFSSIIYAITPFKEDFQTISGKRPFSSEFEMLVPYRLKGNGQALVVGTAFDYLARFRIGRLLQDKKVAEELVAENGFRRLLGTPIAQMPEFDIQMYPKLLEPVFEYIDGKPGTDIETLIPTAYRLSKLEDIARGGLMSEKVNINELFYGFPEEEVANELKGLMKVFEEKFMIPEIINVKSNVIFNPHFGVGGALVGGADADLLIDGTLYDFKTTKSYGYKLVDAEQLMGYYLLNQMSIEFESELIGLSYEELKIERIVFYKARFGEFEFFDLSNITMALQNDVIQKLAKFFTGKTGMLRLMSPFADIDQLDSTLKEYAADQYVLEELVKRLEEENKKK